MAVTLSRQRRELQLGLLGLTSGALNLRVLSNARGWTGYLEAERVPVPEVVLLLGIAQLLPSMSVTSGTATLHGSWSLGAAGGGKAPPGSLALNGSVRELAFSSPGGHYSGEELDVSWQGSVSMGGDNWRFGASLAVTGGGLFVDPLYLEAPSTGEKATPLTLDLEGMLSEDRRKLELQRLNLSHPGVLDLWGAAAVRASQVPEAGAGGRWHIERLRLSLEETPVAGLYEVYLQPLLGTMGLAGTLGKAKAKGTVSASLDWPERLSVNMHELQIEDAPMDVAAGVAEEGSAPGGKPGRFGLYGLSGGVHWSRASAPSETRLTWEGGYYGRADFGPGALTGVARDSEFRLTQPLRVPLLGGTLGIDRLQVDAIGRPAASWEFQGHLTAIPIERVTLAWGWPAMGGTLSGVIPSVRYAGGVMTIDGAVQVRVFDGAVVIHNLVVQNPLALSSILRADVEVFDVDLDALTRAFSFGNIQGRLEGHVHDLVLSGWEPESFDAAFMTPEDDSSRHRISQRAVETLARFGGASGSVLSQTFLRFFKEFSYDRLGLSCRLRDGECEMGGVEPAENGYYIVKGGGIPRIDVLGYERRVDWHRFLEQIKAARQSTGPEIR